MAWRLITYRLPAGQREAEWAEFVSDCGKYEAELAGEAAAHRAVEILAGAAPDTRRPRMSRTG